MTAKKPAKQERPKLPDECVYPTCYRKKLRNLSMCRKHQPYPAT